MRKNVIVNEYSVRIDYYDKDGDPTTSEIHYDGGDYEFIDHLHILSYSFYYPYNKRKVIGYEYCDGERRHLSDEEFERFI